MDSSRAERLSTRYPVPGTQYPVPSTHCSVLSTQYDGFVTARCGKNVQASGGHQFSSNRCPAPGGVKRAENIASLPSFSFIHDRFAPAITKGNEVNKECSDLPFHGRVSTLRCGINA